MSPSNGLLIYLTQLKQQRLYGLCKQLSCIMQTTKLPQVLELFYMMISVWKCHTTSVPLTLYD